MTDEALDNPAPEAGPSEVIAPESIIDTPALDMPSPQTWPDNWRNEMAGDDEKQLKMLERLKSPLDLGKSWFESQKVISSRKPAIEKPGDDATEEQISAYRESIGVPSSPDGYDLNFDDGTVIGDDVRPQLDGFLNYAHESNMPADQVKSTVSWFMKDVEAQAENLRVANDEARISGTAELQAEWGGEFKGNMNAINSLFTEAPKGTLESLLSSAGPDGLKFANKADNIRWLVGLAKQVNPTATLVPPGPDQAGSIDAEIEKIQKIMNSPDKTESSKYWKDDKMQARFAQLNQAKHAR